MFDTVAPMDHSGFALALPDDPDLIGRLTTALAVQADPPISLARSGETVIAFESATTDLMLRCRVIQALELAVGSDWQAVIRPGEYLVRARRVPSRDDGEREARCPRDST